MTPEEVRQFFADPANDGKIATALRQSRHDLDEMESHSASVHSPGPVRNEETLARQLFSPLMMDPDTLKPTTLALKDAESRGLSVDRLELCGAAAVHQRGFDRAAEVRARKGTTTPMYEGFSAVQCGAVRALRDSREQRRFYVFDTALVAHPFHADICHGRFADDKERVAARAALMEAFSPVVRPA